MLVERTMMKSMLAASIAAIALGPSVLGNGWIDPRQPSASPIDRFPEAASLDEGRHSPDILITDDDYSRQKGDGQCGSSEQP
jgi:hypothetical protein